MLNASITTNKGARIMIIERQGNGSLLISDIVDGYLLKQVYYFYSKREAIKLFKNLKKDMQLQLLVERVSKKIIWKENNENKRTN
jgi:hypothetical protein